MAVRNIARGGGAANKPIVEQLRELEKKLGDLRDGGSGRLAKDVVTNAGRIAFNAVVSSAAAANVPHEAQQDIFISTRQPENKKGISVLVGLRKRGRGQPYAHGYVEWFAGSQRGGFKKTQRTRTKQRSLSVRGRKIGESLATMWELGTTKHAPRPFFRTAIERARNGITSSLIDGYRGIVDRLAK